MEYLVKVSAVIAIFYLCYLLFLQRDTFFKQNRWYLLLGLMASFLVPMYVVKDYVTVTALQITGFKSSQTVNETMQNGLDTTNLIFYLYLIGVVFFLVRFIFQISTLFKLIFQSKRQKLAKYTFVETNSHIAPFSFFNWIVYNPKQFNDAELKQIINHEKIHAKQYHSIDVLLTQIACIVLWFNPVIWLYNKQLKQNLEFLADYNAIKASHCKKHYQYTLLKTSLPNHQLALSNAFYNSLIKKRIVMLHKSKSKNINLIKFTFVLPLLALFLMSFNTETVYIEQDNLNLAEINVKNTITVIISKSNTEAELQNIKSKLQNMGLNLKFKTIKRNSSGDITTIKIEANSKNSKANYNIKKDTGITPIQITFNKDEDTINIGAATAQEKVVKIVYNTPDSTSTKKISTYSYTVSDKDKDNELIINNNNQEIRVVQIGNGEVVKVTPESKIITSDEIKIINKDEIKIINTDDPQKKEMLFINTNNENPIYVVDGEIISKTDMSQLLPENIQEIKVLKGDKAIETYGAKGKNGVIIIETKK
ncbi:hypothetical protein PK35_02210 [Tamlana nanhaiensis]|uniref:Peptidase M56 domain-containing protein n=1 Tax=Neotamlana nanhaiensis TaxID=1382798 RepID=A0A0D7W661_9FLAO|nr:M56 family metallopeptidase [Tamlana nanhaiensis]KJD34615.1 hypothetical protein PK35_02210 [Tamlana nanhaiensis]